MAEDRPTRRAEQASETAKASEQDASGQDTDAAARNPKDLGTDVEKLPPVPGAGQFMPADQATEEVAPATEQKKG
jgi:hypothetical protein